MPNSLRCKLRKLRFQEKITEEEYKWLINKLDKHNKILEEMYKPKWIPCSERLPEEYAYVICCTDAEEVFIATYLGKMNDGVDCFDDNDGMMWEGDIIAWMPLPTPYQPPTMM